MSLITVNPGDTVVIPLQLYNRDTNQYPQCVLYDSAGLTIATVNLSHIANGFYQGTYTTTGNDKYLSGHILVYTNSGHTEINEGYDARDVQLYIDYIGKSFGGGVSASVSINEDDFKKIAELVYKKLKPELDKKSEFNSNKDLVSFDDKKISKIEFDLEETKKTIDADLRDIKKNLLSDKDLEKIIKKIPDNKELKDLPEIINSLINQNSEDKNKFIENIKWIKDISQKIEVITKEGNDNKVMGELVYKNLDELSNKLMPLIPSLEKLSQAEEYNQTIIKLQEVIETVKNINKIVNNSKILDKILNKLDENELLLEALYKEDLKGFKTILNNLNFINKDLKNDLMYLKTNVAMNNRISEMSEALNYLPLK